jgi:flagellar motor switch/type III secretory pathway protein FliN
MAPQLEAAPEIVAPAWQSASKPESAIGPDIAHLLEVPLRTEAILGTLKMKVGSISALKVGTVLRTLRPAGEPLDLIVNSVLFAVSEVCPQGQKLGLRVVGLHRGE